MLSSLSSRFPVPPPMPNRVIDECLMLPVPVAGCATQCGPSDSLCEWVCAGMLKCFLNGLSSVRSVSADTTRLAIETLKRGDDHFYVALQNKKTCDQHVDGIPRITHAVLQSNPLELSRLLQNGAYVDMADAKNGETALMVAVAMQRESMVRILLDSSADVNLHNVNGITALHFSALNADEKISNWLLAAGANVDATTNLGHTVLHNAAMKGAVSLVLTLLQCGANPNVQSYDGFTPLHNAVIFGDTRSVQALLQYGADSKLLTTDGISPLALTGDRHAMISLLKYSRQVRRPINRGDREGSLATYAPIPLWLQAYLAGSSRQHPENMVATPTLKPVVNPDAVVDNRVGPAITPALEPVVNHDAVADNRVGPAITPTLKPVVNPDAVVDNRVGPATIPALEPFVTSDAVADNRVGPATILALDPVVNPDAVADNPVGPAITPALDPVLNPDAVADNRVGPELWGAMTQSVLDGLWMLVKMVCLSALSPHMWMGVTPDEVGTEGKVSKVEGLGADLKLIVGLVVGMASALMAVYARGALNPERRLMHEVLLGHRVDSFDQLWSRIIHDDVKKEAVTCFLLSHPEYVLQLISQPGGIGEWKHGERVAERLCEQGGGLHPSLMTLLRQYVGQMGDDEKAMLFLRLLSNRVATPRLDAMMASVLGAFNGWVQNGSVTPEVVGVVNRVLRSEKYNASLPEQMGLVTGLLCQDHPVGVDIKQKVWMAMCQYYGGMAPLDIRRVCFEAMVSQQLPKYELAIFGNALSDNGQIECGMSLEAIDLTDRRDAKKELVFLRPLNTLFVTRRNGQDELDCYRLLHPIFVETDPTVGALVAASRQGDSGSQETVNYAQFDCSRRDMMGFSRSPDLLTTLAHEWSVLWPQITAGHDVA